MNKVVLVTGIGGNVGQGILRNIRNNFPTIKLVGTNTVYHSAGNHFCDKVYEVPFSMHKDYISTIVAICAAQKVDLIIPATDYEVYYLGEQKEHLPKIAATESKTAQNFINKYKTWELFQQANIPFAKSFLPSQYKNNFTNCIVKPAEGRGSRGIEINPPSPSSFSDDFIVQELIEGVEITTAFYVTSERELHSLITFTRELYAGATNKCEVTFEYNELLKPIILDIIKHFNVQGSINLQSIVRNGKIFPFEVNCRISGTNSIRANFGFEDVKYTIEEFLYGNKPSNSIVKKGTAFRVLMDIIYPDISETEINDKSKSYIY